jgi:hypothetical protein
MFNPGVRESGCLGAPPTRMRGDARHAWNPLSASESKWVLEYLEARYGAPFDDLVVSRCRRCWSCRVSSNGPGRPRRHPPDFEMVVRIAREGDPVPTHDFGDGFKA